MLETSALIVAVVKIKCNLIFKRITHPFYGQQFAILLPMPGFCFQQKLQGSV